MAYIDPTRRVRQGGSLARGALCGALALIGAAGLPAGCAGSRDRAPKHSDAPAEGVTLYAPLRTLAERQAKRPDARAAGLTDIPGFDASAIPSIDAADSRARATVDEALGAFPSLPDASSREDGATDPQALRLYVAAREKMVAGRAGEALRDLEAAARLDASSPAIWREQGEAMLLLGRRASGLQAIRRAVDLGLREPRALWLTGREELRAGRDEAGVSMLGASRRAGRTALASVDLGEALGRLGYARASRDLLEEGLLALRPPAPMARDGADLAGVFRRRGELWMRVGDLSMSLGEETRALRAYDAAESAPGVDERALLARRVRAALRAGQSAEAALELMERLVDADGRVNEDVVPLLGFLARETDAGEALGEAAPDALRALGPRATPTTRGQAARAVAAALPEGRARRVLREHLATTPDDDDTLRALLAITPQPARVTEELVRLTRAHPMAAAAAVDALIAHGRGLDEVVRLLAKGGSPEALLLAGVAHTKLGRAREGLGILARVTTPPEALRPALEAARAGAADDARDEAAQRAALAALEALGANGNTDARLAAAMALAGARRHPDALAMLRPALAPEAAPRVPTLLLGADLHVRTGDAPEAEALIRRAIETDRFDERGHEALLGFHGPEGPRPDERAAGEAARALRDAVPESRIARLVAARDFASRGLWAQADDILRRIMPPDGEDPAALGLLATVWERSVGTNPEIARAGRAWAEARLADRPGAPALTVAYARVLAALGEGEAAESLLASRSETWPMPEFLRTREAIVRFALLDPVRADALARERLERAPVTFETAMELAELHVRAGRPGDAADALARALPEGSRPTEAQAQRLLALLGQLRPAQPTPEAARGAVRVFDLAQAWGVPLSPPLLLSRVGLLALGAPDDTGRILGELRVLSEAIPDIKLGAIASVAQALLALEDPGPVLRFLPGAAELFTPAHPPLLFEWFRITVLRGGVEDVRRLIDSADAEQMLAVIRSSGSDVDEPEDKSLIRAALAYAVGVNLSTLERYPEAFAAYRRAIEIDPRHGWSLNNLGYLLLEQGGDIEECERLIEAAHRALPDEHSVTDSLAWVRYKRGMIDDGPDGREGALTLLRQAVEEQGGDDNPTILDHYADALWRAGKRDDAILRWRQSRQVLEITLAGLELGASPDAEPGPWVRKLRADLERVRAKLEAAENGRVPAVAPITHAPDPLEKE